MAKSKKVVTDITLLPKIKQGRCASSSYKNESVNQQRRVCASLFALHRSNGWSRHDAALDVGYSPKTLENWRLIFGI